MLHERSNKTAFFAEHLKFQEKMTFTYALSVKSGKLKYQKQNGSIDVKMGGSVLEEKSSFKMLGLTFSSKLDWVLTLSLLLKLHPRKLEL